MSDFFLEVYKLWNFSSVFFYLDQAWRNRIETMLVCSSHMAFPVEVMSRIIAHWGPAIKIIANRNSHGEDENDIRPQKKARISPPDEITTET